MEEITTQQPATDDPNKRYVYDLGTWSSTSDVDTFFSRFNHNNGYYDSDTNTKLGLGDYVTIQDGTYNATWVIAGFDMEHNQTAADGTIYDNGYGICLIPNDVLTTSVWGSSYSFIRGYKSSTMHTSTLPNIVTKLKNVLGSHIVNRNVLLSNGVDSNYYSNAYAWTTSYATLMSVGQLTGKFASHNNKYDSGEANYKLPLFNYVDYNMGLEFWFRGVHGNSGNIYNAWCISISNSTHKASFGAKSINTSYGVLPLIYLR